MEFASDFAYLTEEIELESIEEVEYDSTGFNPAELAAPLEAESEESKRPQKRQAEEVKSIKAAKKLPTFKPPQRKAAAKPSAPSEPVSIAKAPAHSKHPSIKGRAAPKALLSQADSHALPPFVPPAKRPVPPAKPKTMPKIQKCSVPIQKLDTNVVNIRLDVLANDSEVATGDPNFCSNCRALLNSHSVLTKTADNYEWVCEFCGVQNDLMLDEEEIPRQEELNYILEDAHDVLASDNDATIIFCIDISGSMGVTKPATGRIKLKTNKHEELLKLLQPDERDQFLPGQNRNVTYISRLECVQAAIDAQLTAMQTKMPTRKVGLVVFNRDVRIIGDGSHEEVITGDKLDSYEQCWSIVQDRLDQFIPTTVAESHQNLSTKLFGLEETGPTALGPALLMSVGLACQGKPGSKVIICTDGLANVGLGAFEDSDLETVQTFYEQLGETAKASGVSVSVVSIEGEECRLEELSIMVDATEGEISMVDPEHLAENFANILSDQLIATHASATVTMHKALAFRNAEPSSLSINGSQMSRSIGNVNTSTTFSFEYQLKAKTELEGLDITSIAALPFQVAIYYTKPSGQKCIRSITKQKLKTNDRRQAEAASNFNVLASHAQSNSAALAQKGQWQKAQSSISAWNSVLSRNVKSDKDNAVFRNAASNLHQLSSALAEQQMEEAEGGIHIDEQVMDVESVKRSRAHKMKDRTVSTINKLKKRG